MNAQLNFSSTVWQGGSSITASYNRGASLDDEGNGFFISVFSDLTCGPLEQGSWSGSASASATVSDEITLFTGAQSGSYQFVYSYSLPPPGDDGGGGTPTFNGQTYATPANSLSALTPFAPSPMASLSAPTQWQPHRRIPK